MTPRQVGRCVCEDMDKLIGKPGYSRTVWCTRCERPQHREFGTHTGAKPCPPK